MEETPKAAPIDAVPIEMLVEKTAVGLLVVMVVELRDTRIAKFLKTRRITTLSPVLASFAHNSLGV